MKIPALILAALSLTGCATVLIEAEHISHPGAGWPVGPASDESQLTQGNFILRWKKGAFYMDAGLGVKLYERHPRDFVGPKVTGTVRLGAELVRL